MTKLLSREDILNAPDLETEEVEVPEWGGMVLIKGLTGQERDEFEASVVDRRGKKVKMNMDNLRARLVALSVVDGEGKRIFRRTDVEALGKKSAAALDRVFSASMRLSGMREEDVEELVENFTREKTDDSISG